MPRPLRWPPDTTAGDAQPPAWTEPAFADTALAAAVRAAAPDTAAWVALTERTAGGRGISSLDGIGALGALVSLDLSGNQVSDSTPLADLVHQERLAVLSSSDGGVSFDTLLTGGDPPLVVATIDGVFGVGPWDRVLAA